jgi:hypothetical protein
MEASDGVMVARGDLGVETDLAMIPVHQKLIIREANRRGIPVITATQMLESMMRQPLPTRAEVTDVANAIYDGSHAVEANLGLDRGWLPADGGEDSPAEAVARAACRSANPDRGGYAAGVHPPGTFTGVGRARPVPAAFRE